MRISQYTKKATRCSAPFRLDDILHPVAQQDMQHDFDLLVCDMSCAGFRRCDRRKHAVFRYLEA